MFKRKRERFETYAAANVEGRKNHYHDYLDTLLSLKNSTFFMRVDNHTLLNCHQYRLLFGKELAVPPLLKAPSLFCKDSSLWMYKFSE